MVLFVAIADRFPYMGVPTIPPIINLASFVFWLFVSSLFLWFGAQWLQERRVALVIVALLCGAISSCPFIPTQENTQLIVVILRVALSGICISFSITLWMEFLCVQFKNRVRLAAVGTLTLAMFWTLIFMTAEAQYKAYLLFAAAIIPSCIYLFLWRKLGLISALPIYDIKETDEKCKITWNSTLLTIMGSLAQGFALAWVCAAEEQYTWMSLFVAGVAFLVSAIALLDVSHRVIIREAVIRKFFLPVLATCILTLLFVPENWNFIPVTIAFGFSLLPYTTANIATCEHIVTSQLAAMRIYPRTRLCSTGGLCLGLLLGYVTICTNIVGETTLQIGIVFVVALLIVVFSLLSTNSHYPGEEDDDITTELPDGEALTYMKEASIIDGSYFRSKCDVIADEYGLTERQREVLYLLARGRNAAYIRDELVISPHTVKAHIYTIYKKTGQHSQQGIINLVEGTNPADKKG